jgi:6-phospho-3-hexuloisomerase
MPEPSPRAALLRELETVLSAVDEAAIQRLARAIAGAGRIVLFGLGREGLAIRGFCMRLMHLGLDAHMAGDVTARPVGSGDLVIVSSGPGNLLLARSMLELANRTGSGSWLMTAQPDGPDARLATDVMIIPAQTMATDRDSNGVLAMGTAYELAMSLVFELVVIELQRQLNVSPEEMRARHFNLE